MDIINFSKANCSNCYKCVRECPVKAIKLKDEQAEIVNSLCIGCGRCLLACPKNAKQIMSDIDIVKKHINNGDTVVVSVAPSFVAAFDFKYPEQFVTALKQIGFSRVEQTAVGAGVISQSYNEYYNRDDNKNYITTSCTAANYLIQHYYPSLVDEMIPVVSPMVCHAKMLKEKYGQHIKTVFIGPCLAKKIEALREEAIDYILTFDEIIKWFENEKIVLEDLDPIPFDLENKDASLYPIIQGIASTLDNSDGKDIFCVDGIENCIDLLKCMDKGKINNTFIEISLCDNSCINGPAMPSENSVYIRKNKVKKYVQNCQKSNDDFKLKPKDYDYKDIDISTKFKDLSPIINIPSEDEIKEILSSTGKLKESDELNCGACGYDSCRDKAIAVYNKMAENNMCMPYMRQRAETISNIIFDVTPNIIFILNDDLEIIEFNPSSEALFNVKKRFAINKPIVMFMDDEDFINVKNTKKDIIAKKIHLKEHNSSMLKTVLYVEEYKAMVVIMTDITEDEVKEKKLKELKMNTLNMAQEVINKQMRVAQEIASLLGETTAETKVILTKLKKVVQDNEDDIR